LPPRYLRERETWHGSTRGRKKRKNKNTSKDGSYRLTKYWGVIGEHVVIQKNREALCVDKKLQRKTSIQTTERKNKAREVTRKPDGSGGTVRYAPGEEKLHPDNG